MDNQLERFNEALLEAQSRWVPHKQQKTRASVQPWFGPQCRADSHAKYRACGNYKRHCTWRNKERHREAATHMEATQIWAREQWVESRRGS